MWRRQQFSLSDPGFTELPEHLQYKPPTVETSFEGVESRYWYGPKAKKTPADFDRPRPPTPTRNSPFKDVEARFRNSSPKRTPPPTDHIVQPLKPTESVRQTKEYAAHKRTAAAVGMGGACSKYYDMYAHQSTQVTTRRQAVESTLKDEKKKMHNTVFRPTMSHTSTFSEMERENEELKQWSQSPRKSSTKRVSIVMDYVKNGTPIKGFESPVPRTTSPFRRPTPRMGNKPFYGGGGAGGGTMGARANSPKKQVRELENTKVQELRKEQWTAKTKTPPRVASLEHPFIVRSHAPDPLFRNDSPIRSTTPQQNRNSSAYRRTNSGNSSTMTPPVVQHEQMQPVKHHTRRLDPPRAQEDRGDFDVVVNAPPEKEPSAAPTNHSANGIRPTDPSRGRLQYYRRQPQIFPSTPPSTKNPAQN